MVVYADTSFLFSLYAQDANTAHAAELAGVQQGALVVTPLQRHPVAQRAATFRLSRRHRRRRMPVFARFGRSGHQDRRAG